MLRISKALDRAIIMEAARCECSKAEVIRRHLVPLKDKFRTAEPARTPS